MLDEREDRILRLLNAVQGHSQLRQRPTERRLDRLIEHAIRTVPFYEARFRGSVPALEELPVVSRQDFVDDEMSFRSCTHGLRDVVETYTSGTTGLALRVVWDAASYYQYAFDIYREVFARVPELSGTLRAGFPAVLILNDNLTKSSQVLANPSLDFAQVRRVILGHNSEEDADAWAIAASEQAPLLYGRPRTLMRLAEIAEDLSIARTNPLRPCAVLSSGDNLYDSDRRVIETTFRARVYNAYVSQEGGFLTLQCPLTSALHVLTDRAHVEVLSDFHSEPAAMGAGEIVVTNLGNWAMPFFRYRSGDRGVVTRGVCVCGHEGASFVQLDGRDTEYFVIAGERVVATKLNPVFESLPIRHFQVRQTGPAAFRVRFVPEATADKEIIERLLAERIQERLGCVTLAMERTDQISEAGQKVQRYLIEAGVT
ncbi:MAG TPA: hypothetical protein VES67_15055 [Vicinamibacterales bacterium]|nr:hypothetical protein [Vicinamibacterales bacterium]